MQQEVIQPSAVLAPSPPAPNRPLPIARVKLVISHMIISFITLLLLHKVGGRRLACRLRAWIVK
jgi:hypothetical protein